MSSEIQIEAQIQAKNPGKAYLRYLGEYASYIPVIPLERIVAIIFGGICIAFTFATFMIAMALEIPEFQTIAGFAAALTLYICLEQVYDTHTIFVFVGCVFISSVGAVAGSGILANLPGGLILRTTLQMLMPSMLALLVGMKLVEYALKLYMKGYRWAFKEE